MRIQSCFLHVHIKRNIDQLEHVQYYFFIEALHFIIQKYAQSCTCF